MMACGDIIDAGRSKWHCGKCSRPACQYKRYKRKANAVQGSVALAIGVAIIAWLLSGCATGDQRIEGMPAEVLRHITGHDATTVGPKSTLFFGENAPSGVLKKHEACHRRQAKFITDPLVEMGAIDDDELSRSATWIAIYTVAWTQYGRANRFEKECWSEQGQ